ncbi:(3R)-hydroxymyristoyl-[acyl carrier protein] dehydratase [Flavobacteriaceae bacterium 3519-10]|nr:(3R)-hydroxymyristoyl-[acyl carrier protein] dehydratase [Flavobacteriaceae bacterium 3519-10]
MSITANILQQLPFSEPYLFVDELHYVNDEGASGSYTFRRDLPFYQGHFKDAPVTPGAILIEVMAQIGGSSLGIYLSSQENGGQNPPQLCLASSYEASFFLPVYPGERVTVVSEKVYFRFNKLKFKVQMVNSSGSIICRGVFTGMLKAR